MNIRESAIIKYYKYYKLREITKIKGEGLCLGM